MAITIKEVEYIARLARIELKPDELKYFTSQLDKILEYINKLKELDLSSVNPVTHVLSVKNVFREDKIKPSLDRNDVLKSAGSKEKEYFKVPKIIE